MSFPNIPDINADINIDRADVVNSLLASIAFEELGLAHVINAEAEKIQFVIGTLPGQTPSEPLTINNLLNINKSVDQILRTVIKNQMLLQFKLEDLLEMPPAPEPLITVHFNTATVTATFEGETVTDSDSAYYYTIQQ